MRITDYRGKWCAVVRIGGKRSRLSLGNLDATPENRAAAERAAADLERELARPIGDTCEEVFEAYLADSRAIDKDRLVNAWKALRGTFGHLRPDQITRERCRSYTEARRKAGRGDGTIRKELTTLRAAINWSNKDNGAVFDLPAPPPPRDRWLTKDEFGRLLDAAEQPHLRLFLHLAIATAGRKEALLQLTWPQISWNRGEICLGHKPNGKARATVPMTQTLRTVLREAYDVRPDDCDHVILYEGRPVKSIKRTFATACRNAKLSGVSPHILRHTAAVWMAAAGVDMARIAQYMGHSDSRITERVYARFAPDHLRDAADALEI